MAELAFSELVNRYAFCDPSGGKVEIKRTRARSAIVVVAPDHLNRLFVLFAWAARCSTDKLIEKILDVSDKLHPRIFGMEANAMQTLFADSVRREARQKKLRLPLVPVYQPTTIIKEFRIRSILQPVLAYGRLFIQPSQDELRAELTSFPMGATKDLVDALASAVELVPARATRVERDEEAEALASYLRNTGATPAYIERRLREVMASRN